MYDVWESKKIETLLKRSDMLECILLVDQIENLDDILWRHSPLHVFAKVGNLEGIKYCLRKGANINTCTMDENSSLHFAIFSGHVEIVKLLLEEGINVSKENNNGLTPVDICLQMDNQYGATQILNLLISYGAKLKETMLPVVILSNHSLEYKVSILDIFEQQQIDLFSRDNNSFLLACENDDISLVNYFLLKNVDTHVYNYAGKSAKQICVSNRNWQMYTLINNHI